MTNPIQNSPLGGAGSGSGAGASRVDLVPSRPTGAAPATTTPTAAADTVSISQSARALNAAAAASTANAAPAQIAQLKNAIASGQYQVDPRAIAKGLIRDSLALYNGVQRRG